MNSWFRAEMPCSFAFDTRSEYHYPGCMGPILEGGCIVTDWESGACVENGTLRAYPQIGRANGAKAISLRVLVFASGQSPSFQEVACDEVLYVLEGEGKILLD